MQSASQVKTKSFECSGENITQSNIDVIQLDHINNLTHVFINY